MTTTVLTTPTTPTAPASPAAAPTRIPLRRLVAVELRKSFDTRSGFWLLVGTGLAAVATTILVIAFAPADQLSYSTFTLAIGKPMSILLPLIALLSVTAEWTQRSGLTTFTLVPHRGRVILAKSLAMLLVGILAMVLAFPLGALGNLAGTAIHGVEPVWDQNVTDFAYYALANTLLMAAGFMLGVLIRASAGAIVTYFIYAFITPTLLTFLAMGQDWFRKAQPWVDPNYSQSALFNGGFSAEQWTQLGITSATWLVAPLVIGLVTLLRSEVK
ncbi:ABC transporter permease subunit [Pedococcus sp. 5OH_020]|uniref:ABC transporter permease subunit n=1 Tax=Pedococcus sp. 5OH_020 TaxID=2989814 RepID=UPI0022E9DBBC|nr:ABC transporter permease subunit [Pedococcus sp. 5OH_020]